MAREPGVHLREVPRALGLSLRAARYHLDRLERAGGLVAHRQGRFVRYFPAGGFTRGEREVISAARVAGSRAVLEALRDGGPLRFQALARRASLSHGALFWHLRTLTAANVVAQGADGAYALADGGAVAMALALNRPQLSEGLGDAAREIFERRP